MGLQFNESTLELPSLGIGYPKDMVPLIDGCKVSVRGFVLGDQREIGSLLKGGTIFQIYDRMLELLITEPKKLDRTKLLMTDVFAILFAVRIKSFGSTMDIAFECQNCGDTSESKYNLNELMVRSAGEIEGYKTEGLLFKATVDGKERELSLHLPTLGDERRAIQIVNDMASKGFSKNKEADILYMRRAVLIDTVDGEPMPNMERFDFLMSMGLGEFEDFKIFLRDAQSGIMLDEAKITCEHCEFLQEVTLTITPDFFRAPARRRQ